MNQIKKPNPMSPPTNQMRLRPAVRRPVFKLTVEYALNSNIRLTDKNADLIAGLHNCGGSCDLHNQLRILNYEFINQNDLSKASAALTKAGYHIQPQRR